MCHDVLEGMSATRAEARVSFSPAGEMEAVLGHPLVIHCQRWRLVGEIVLCL